MTLIHGIISIWLCDMGGGGRLHTLPRGFLPEVRFFRLFPVLGQQLLKVDVLEVLQSVTEIKESADVRRTAFL